METMEKSQPQALSNAQKKFLRKLGHSLNPIVYIGKEGLSDTVILAVEEALAHGVPVVVSAPESAPGEAFLNVGRAVQEVVATAVQG